MIYCGKSRGLSLYRPKGRPRAAPAAAAAPIRPRGRAKSLRLPQAQTGAQPRANSREIKRGINGKGEGLRESAEICTKERGNDSR